MGMRAIARIDGQNYYKHWGSPQYQMVGFAVWLQACTLAGVKPTRANYGKTVEALELDGFTEEVAGPLPWDLDWLYDVDITAVDRDDWKVSLKVRGPRLWAEEGKDFEQGLVAFEATVCDGDLTELAAGVTRYAEQFARLATESREVKGWHEVIRMWRDYKATRTSQTTRQY